MKAFFSVLDLKDHEAIRVLNVTFKWFLKKFSLNVYFKSIYVFCMYAKNVTSNWILFTLFYCHLLADIETLYL